MDLRHVWNVALGWTKQNSSLVLSGIAVGGVVSTAVLAIKAGEDTQIAYQDDFQEIGPLSRTEAIRKYWLLYIPPAVSAALTITAIVCAHNISVRKQAAVASALVISEKTLYDYREKVADLIGRRKAEQAHEEVIQDRIDDRPPWDSEVVKTDNGNTLCYDTYTGRYFQSTKQAIDNAVNMLNNQLNNHEYASLNDFYGFVGLGSTAAGDDLGWNCNRLLEVSYSSHLAPESEPCLALYFQVQPIPDYYKVY